MNKNRLGVLLVALLIIVGILAIGIQLHIHSLREETPTIEETPVIEEYAIGEEITLAGEKFNVISQTEYTVTMLAQYSLGTVYEQTKTIIGYNDYGLEFADAGGWEYAPGPKEINIQILSTDPKIYVHEYVLHLKRETGITGISGDLITLAELKSLGCTVSDDYSWVDGLTCENSENADWLVNGQSWWTRSASSDFYNLVWIVTEYGGLDIYFCNYADNGIRPVITVKKDELK